MIALQRIALAVALAAATASFSAASFADEQPAAETEAAAPTEPADRADKPECDKGISLSPEELVASLDAATDC